MQRFTCDRCDKPITGHADHVLIEIRPVTDSDAWRKRDLCTGCLTDLRTWFATPPAAGPVADASPAGPGPLPAGTGSLVEPVPGTQPAGPSFVPDDQAFDEFLSPAAAAMGSLPVPIGV